MRAHFAIAVVLLVAVDFACADSRALVGVEPSLDGGGGAASNATGDGALPGFTGPGDASVGVERGCSADLQSVVGADGTVIEACAPERGCAAGTCVPACQAASESHGSLGCDFVVATPAFYSSTLAPYGDLPPCFAVFISNTWSKDVKISVTRGGTSYDVTGFGRMPSSGSAGDASTWPKVPATGLPPNQVAVLFLSSDPNATNANGPTTCPVTPAINGSTAVVNASTTTPSTTGIGQAWHITTDVPVSGYDILPYGGAHTALPSADLLQPTTAWGTGYVAVQPGGNVYGNNNQPWAQVVAMHDGTEISVVPNVDLPAGAGVAAAPKNQVSTFKLNAGEFIQWQFDTGTTSDMSGTVLSSNHPIAFYGGNGNFCLTSSTSPTGGGCDSEQSLVPPVSALGSEYALSPFATRRLDMQPEAISYRIAGIVDGTTLTYDPPVAGAPSSLALGEVVDFESTIPFVVKGQDEQHPIAIMQRMPGCYVTGGSRPGINPQANYGNCLGDEEQVAAVPPAQWLSKYVFFTDPTYPTTNIVLTRRRTSTGFKEVTVDCVGNVTGWQSIGASGEYEMANLDFVRGTVPNGSCANGRHTATSDGPFGLVVWGLDSVASYAYPAGGNFRSINTVVVPVVPK